MSLSLVSKKLNYYILKFSGVKKNAIRSLLSNVSGKMSERERKRIGQNVNI